MKGQCVGSGRREASKLEKVMDGEGRLHARKMAFFSCLENIPFVF